MSIDIFKIAKLHNESNNYNTTFVDNLTLFKDEKNNVYVTSFKEGNKFVVYDALKKEVVKEPTAYQKMYGLLNHIAIENKLSPEKTGHYKMSYKNLFYNFLDDVSDIKYGKLKSETKFAELWAIPQEDKKAFSAAAKDLIESIKTNEETL